MIESSRFVNNDPFKNIRPRGRLMNNSEIAEELSKKLCSKMISKLRGSDENVIFTVLMNIAMSCTAYVVAYCDGDDSFAVDMALEVRKLIMDYVKEVRPDVTFGKVTLNGETL